MNRWYDTQRWRHLREICLDKNPLCAMCLKMGRETPASVVDHIEPHNGNYDLFWEVNNLQSLCASCHSGSKRHQENTGYSPGCDVNGFPLDFKHPFNRRK